MSVDFESAPTVEARLAARLRELSVVTRVLDQLPACEIRGHVAGVRSYLHDEVIRQAHHEESLLFPVLQRVGTVGMEAALSAEHDTVRLAAAQLDDMAARPLTTATVDHVAGLLSGVEQLLDSHLSHEADVSLEVLQHLEAGERDDLLAQLDAVVPFHTPRPSWLPEDLPREQTVGPADHLEPEAMIGSSCAPSVLEVVRSAIAAVQAGVAAAAWRSALAEHSRYRLQVQQAEECMRSAGLWPWTTAA